MIMAITIQTPCVAMYGHSRGCVRLCGPRPILAASPLPAAAPPVRGWYRLPAMHRHLHRPHVVGSPLFTCRRAHTTLLPLVFTATAMTAAAAVATEENRWHATSLLTGLQVQITIVPTLLYTDIVLSNT